MNDAVCCSIFNQRSQRLAEIEPTWEFVNWRLNRTGMARFSLPYSDPKNTPDLLAYGNRVLIKFGNGLPDWGGVIDVPRRRDRNGVRVTAYTGEKLLDWRVTAKSRSFSQQQPGYVAQTLIEEENAIWPTGVLPGTIYLGGTVRTLEYHYHDLLQRILDLQRLTGNDFAVTPSLSGNTLTFVLNWYERRGQDLSSKIVLMEDINVGDVVLDEQGLIANHIRLAGEGSTWGTERISSDEEFSATSRDTYGYREYGEVQAGVSEQTTLDANAAAMLAEMELPHRAYTVKDARNLAPALFASYDVGDSVQLIGLLDSGAWDPINALVRVIAREWQPNGMCQLEVL